MKWNNPATWLVGGTVLAVGLMAVAGARRGGALAKVNADCTRITLTNEAAWDDALVEEMSYVLGSDDPVALAQGSIDRLLGDLPGCRSPLPDDTVIVTFDNRELLVGELRDLFMQAAKNAETTGAAAGAAAGGCRRCLGVR